MNSYFQFGLRRARHDGDWAMYYEDFRHSPQCADLMDGGLFLFDDGKQI